MKLGLSYTELVKGINDNTFTSNEVWDFYVNRMSKYQILHAFLNPQVSPSKLPPVALKDNIVTTRVPTTASSYILSKSKNPKDGYISPYNSSIVEKLYSAGIGFLGKTNLDAWAHGSSTESSDFGPSLNPYNTEHVPGGSSGGSAVAVAAGLAPAAIGTETAGSIRLPAAWSGVVGLKPTYGRVSRYGIIAMGSSWDCPGPITQTVEDAALLLGIIAGHDTRDATSLDAPVDDYVDHLSEERTLTVGYCEDYFNNVDPEIAAATRETLKILEKQGHTVKKIELIDPKYAISVYMILQRAEVSSNLGRYDGIRYGKDRTYFGSEAKKRIMLGTYVLSSGYADKYYTQAQKVRYVIAESFKKAFEDVDIIVAPSAPITAPKIGESEKFAFFGEMMDVLSEPASAAGIPAISIPVGLHSNGLPMGVQIMGNHLDEKTILWAANQLEHEFAFDRLSVMKKYE